MIATSPQISPKPLKCPRQSRSNATLARGRVGLFLQPRHAPFHERKDNGNGAFSRNPGGRFELILGHLAHRFSSNLLKTSDPVDFSGQENQLAIV